MRAIICKAYGSPDVLQLVEVDKPTPQDNEVLIRTHAATVTAGDCEVRRTDLPFWVMVPMRLYLGLLKPRFVLGMELAGEVEAVGKDVTRFNVGDRVFASSGFQFGAYADYKCLPEDAALTTIPANVSVEDAATIPVGGVNALHFIKNANVQPGQKVLINGAGGSIGTYAVQLAKHHGAEVTAVDSGDKLEMLSTIGADHIVDYTQEDFSQRGETYDIILDLPCKGTFLQCVRSLKDDGLLLLGNPRLPDVVRGQIISLSSDKRVKVLLTNETTDDLVAIADMLAAGDLKTVIDKRYPLEQIAEAHRYVEAGHKKGNLIITVAEQ